ncbi:ATP-binding protein [Candidatus Parcubacteria bacterium]|nr:ATP-binding protein [Candidatus Parcubacteria bacterium]
MPILYIMVGVGFSGKSTLAKNISEYLKIPLVSQDALFFEKEKELNLDLDDEKQWEMLLNMCKQRIVKLLREGKSVVYDNVNLRRDHRDELREIAQEASAQTVVIYLDTPEETLNQRQDNNKVTKERHDVKQEYLDDAKAQLEIPTADENPYHFTPETDLNTFLQQLPV